MIVPIKVEANIFTNLYNQCEKKKKLNKLLYRGAGEFITEPWRRIPMIKARLVSRFSFVEPNLLSY